MKLLVVGKGGREHAFVWKLAQSPKITKLYAAPGSPGMAQHAECVDISDSDLTGLADVLDHKVVKFIHTLVSGQSRFADG